MTRQELAIILAGALSILCGFKIFGAFSRGGECYPPHRFGLGIAIGRLIIDLGSPQKDRYLPPAESKG